MKTKVIFLILVLAPLFLHAQEEGELLLQQVKEAYSALNTYQDEGVASVFRSNKTKTIPFRNFFSKPSKVRFEFVTFHPFFPLSLWPINYAVWYDGTNSYFACGGKVEKRNSIYAAWGGAYGKSFDASPHLSSFLLQRALGSGVYKGKYWTVVGTGKVRDVDCIHAEVKQWRGDDVHVWVGKQDHMIRRIIDGEVTIEYISISTNIPIDESLFEGK